MTRASAHEIRLVGNEMAHGDLADEIAEEEAEEVLMDEVLAELFQSQGRRDRARAAREARRSRSTVEPS